MKITGALLFPFSLVYGAVTDIRNRLYDQGLKPSATFDIPVIGVGNLTVGGTGKTPMTEYLVRLLRPFYQVACLSRGYGRVTRGVRVVGDSDDPSTVGDEPYQIFRKFHPDVTVAVAEERAVAIPYLADQYPVQVVLMDDSFQHRRVRPGFQILLTDYQRLFYKDWLMPSGRLRESRKGARRADVIVVTKCPEGIAEEELAEIEAGIGKHSDKPVYFSSVRYKAMVPMGAASELREKAILVSGIANARPLEDHIAANFQLVRHFNFRDHYRYGAGELERICSLARKDNAMVVTTEKDAVKLGAERWRSFMDRAPFFYLPLEAEFIKSGKDFDERVLNAVKNA